METPNFRQEVPEIEEFVNWLCDHPETGERMALRIQREALYKAYIRGRDSARPAEPVGHDLPQRDGLIRIQCVRCLGEFYLPSPTEGER